MNREVNGLVKKNCIIKTLSANKLPNCLLKSQMEGVCNLKNFRWVFSSPKYKPIKLSQRWLDVERDMFNRGVPRKDSKWKKRQEQVENTFAMSLQWPLGNVHNWLFCGSMDSGSSQLTDPWGQDRMQGYVTSCVSSHNLPLAFTVGHSWHQDIRLHSVLLLMFLYSSRVPSSPVHYSEIQLYVKGFEFVMADYRA